MEGPRYHLILRQPDGTEQTADFRSLTGDTYAVGDTLSVEPGGETWKVVAEDKAVEPFLATLICERAQP